MYLLFFVFLLSFGTKASEIPCQDFEVLVREHGVKSHQRDDGVQVSSTKRREHCRALYPGSENWLESFKIGKINEWPFKEVFKGWNHSEKDLVLSLIAKWPDDFLNYSGMSFHRSIRSRTKGNPAASLPKSKSIVLYDNFFQSRDQARILTHEMAHIHILNLDPDKLEKILKKLGWDYDKNHRPYWTNKRKPLKPDSINSPSEDLANHIEEFLHLPKNLEPNIRKSFEDLLGKDFKLKEKQ